MPGAFPAPRPVAAEERPHPQAAGLTYEAIIALGVSAAIACHLLLRLLNKERPWINDAPLVVALVAGGGPLIVQLLRRMVRGVIGSDVLAGVSIVTAWVLHQYLAGAIIVLMLAGGAALEAFAVKQASSVLRALANRLPLKAHRWQEEQLVDVPLSDLCPGDSVLLLPHEVCPADAIVVEGHGAMNESFLTGEPYAVGKAPGAEVLSGAVNGEAALTVRVSRRPTESRYARIMDVVRQAEQGKTQLRRLGDQLGAWFTPVALLVAILAWVLSADPHRFLAVLVVATPCPLIVAIPVAIIGAISLSARRGVIIRDPSILERLDTCRTIILDKTGTLTYGRPRLSLLALAPAASERDVLFLAASLERYSHHPLAQAVRDAATQANIHDLAPAVDVHEPPGAGLRGRIAGHLVVITGRKHLPQDVLQNIPPTATGLECVVLIDGRYAATLQFADEPREELRSFIAHLSGRHRLLKTILLTGDQAAEAKRIAAFAGIQHVLADQSPEDKLAVVRREVAEQPTLYVGDGINDAPSLMAASMSIALGTGAEAAVSASDAVVIDPSLRKLDEVLHIARHLRRIVLQSAAGGMALSLVAIGFAATGHLQPIGGALIQECIDVLAVLNALRAAFPPKALSDY
jgi:heavy metal translocating P-type ATPase